jgi:hypothetical protein
VLLKTHIATAEDTEYKYNVKLSVWLINLALHHCGVWGSGGIAPPFLTLAVDEGEWSAWCPLGRKLDGPQGSSRFCGEEKNVLCLPGIELWPSNPQPVTVPTKLSWLVHINILLHITYSLGSHGLQPAPLHHSSHLFTI